jgi:hypothetical protein
MGIITRAQKQTLVYWPYTGADLFGQPTYGTPVQMTCRWEDMLKQVYKSDGSPVFSKIELITKKRLEPKGLVWKGVLAKFTAALRPDNSTGVHEIIAASSTPNLRNTETLYEAWA